MNQIRWSHIAAVIVAAVAACGEPPIEMTGRWQVRLNSENLRYEGVYEFRPDGSHWRWVTFLDTDGAWGSTVRGEWEVTQKDGGSQLCMALSDVRGIECYEIGELVTLGARAQTTLQNDEVTLTLYRSDAGTWSDEVWECIFRVSDSGEGSPNKLCGVKLLSDALESYYLARDSIRAYEDSVRAAVRQALSNSGSGNQRVHVVEMLLTSDGNYVYRPASLAIKVGDKVRWLNVSGFPHNVAFYDDQIPSGAKEYLTAIYGGKHGNIGPMNSRLLLQSNEMFEITFAGAPTGSYNYYCTPHEALDMKGTLTVQR